MRNPKVKELEAWSGRVLEAIAEDWSVMVGKDLQIAMSAPKPNALKELAAQYRRDPVLMSTHVEGSDDARVYWVMPQDAGIVLAGLCVMYPEETIRKKMGARLEDEDVEVLREVLNQLCGSANKPLESMAVDYRFSQSVDHLAIKTMGVSGTEFKEISRKFGLIVPGSLIVQGFDAFPVALIWPRKFVAPQSAPVGKSSDLPQAPEAEAATAPPGRREPDPAGMPTQLDLPPAPGAKYILVEDSGYLIQAVRHILQHHADGVQVLEPGSPMPGGKHNVCMLQTDMDIAQLAADRVVFLPPGRTDDPRD